MCKYTQLLVLTLAVLVLCGCEKKKPKDFKTHSPYVTDTLLTSSADNNGVIRIPYQETNGVKTIPVIVNNSIKSDMIYDTGASNVCIALPEAVYMYQQGKLTDSDIIGGTNFRTASGHIHEGLEINIQELQIGEGEESVKIYNVKATVVKSLVAPLLLGQSALEQFASVRQNTEDGYIEFESR